MHGLRVGKLLQILRILPESLFNSTFPRMTKSTLVEILGTFNETEQQRLIDFLRSPWCTPAWQSPEPVGLVSHIFESLNQRSSSNLQKEVIYRRVFPGRPFVFNKLEKLFSGTLKTVRQFIQHEMFAQQTFPAQEYMLQAEFFREKGAYDECDQIYEKLSKWQQNKQKWGTREYTVNWQIEQGKYNYKSEIYQKKGDQNLLSTLEALEELYLSERLFYTCMLLNINQVTPVLSPEATSGMVAESTHPHNARFFASPVGSLYRKAIITLAGADQSDDDFELFCIHLDKHQHHLSDYLYSHFESFAINRCVRHFSNPKYQTILFRLLKQRVEEGRSFVDGKISASEFQNVVKIGLMRKEFDWVWQFMQANRNNIYGSQHPEEYFRFNVANYWFYTEQFDKALDVLLTSDYEEMQYKHSAKLMEIKILYEIESDILPSKIDAAKIFFYREKHIPKDKKDMYCRFADFMRRLIRPQTAVNPERIHKLLQELDEDPKIAELFWLREKLERMLKKSRW